MRVLIPFKRGLFSTILARKCKKVVGEYGPHVNGETNKEFKIAFLAISLNLEPFKERMKGFSESKYVNALN